VKKKVTVVISEHKRLLKELSKDFTIPWGEIGARGHPDFSQYLTD
jgi:hypothetical protein